MISIQRWNPIQEFDRVFNHFLGASTPSTEELVNWAPACDLYESEGEVKIHMDLPGIKKEELEIQLKDPRTLIVRGERKPAAVEGEAVKARRLERATGHFARAFFLPYEVNSEGINATFRDGVLELTLRKPESIKPRRIEIKSE